MKLMTLFLHIALSLIIFGPSVGNTTPFTAGSEAWEYNPGPDPKTESGRAVVDIYAELPEYSEMSEKLMEDQKFRYIFGLMMTRTYFDPNAVKILFVGQDATHIAEAAKQPGTSGFGARVQSIGNFFGVDQGVSTTNAFLSTIKGQYGSFDHIYIEKDSTGKQLIKQSSYVDNELWELANGRSSEIRIKREAFWEWLIKNNPKSLQLIVMFGGAARDAFAEFLISNGAQVGTRFNPNRLSQVQVPETTLVYAGGNNEFPVPINKMGKDIYQILVGRKLDYSKPADQKAAIDALKNNSEKAIQMMVFTGGGLKGSGIRNAAQLGGYDLENVVINGRKTNSLKGLKLKDGFQIKEDIGFTMSPHPTVLSQQTPAQASASLKKSFARLNDLKANGVKIFGIKVKTTNMVAQISEQDILNSVHLTTAEFPGLMLQGLIHRQLSLGQGTAQNLTAPSLRLPNKLCRQRRKIPRIFGRCALGNKTVDIFSIVDQAKKLQKY
jgi:hypothetical protein